VRTNLARAKHQLSKGRGRVDDGTALLGGGRDDESHVVDAERRQGELLGNLLNCIARGTIGLDLDDLGGARAWKAERNPHGSHRDGNGSDTSDGSRRVKQRHDIELTLGRSGYLAHKRALPRDGSSLGDIFARRRREQRTRARDGWSTPTRSWGQHV